MKKKSSGVLASHCVTPLFLHSSLQVEIQPISNSRFSVGLLVVSSNNQTDYFTLNRYLWEGYEEAHRMEIRQKHGLRDKRGHATLGGLCGGGCLSGLSVDLLLD